jgi:nicotinate phosphoribosyltransferase
MENLANTIVGFEGFIRHPKKEIINNMGYYIFEGNEEVKRIISEIQEDLKNENLVDEFINTIKHKINLQENEEIFRKNFKKLNKDFEYEVIDNGTKVFPYIPVFQYRGPVWIGQIIETIVTNAYNGKTGIASVKEAIRKEELYYSSIDIEYIEHIIENVGGKYYERYIEDLNERAKEFKEVSDDIMIFEAGFRRAPNFNIAKQASLIAIKNRWNATSNTAIKEEIDINKIGGSMAHAFVMFFETEKEAFKVWNKYFPNSTILVDTYDTLSAIDILIKENIKPADVRIDSGDFFKITKQVREKLDKNGWQDVGIFLSGDMTPELIMKLKSKGVPFNKIMAGTKYIYNNNIIKLANAGFVYKIVEIHKENKILYPEKKAIGKKSFSGLKKIEMKQKNKVKITKLQKSEKLNLKEIKYIKENPNIQFS